MSNQLEKFVRDNREQFDSDEPSPQVWKNLEKQLSPQKQEKKQGKVLVMRILRLSVAAAIIILAGFGVYSLIKSDKKGIETAQTDQPRQPAAGSNEDILNKINPAYAKEVYHFTQLIELKQSEMKQLEKDNPQLYKQFLGDINKLDSSYNALKKELPDNPNREQLLEAMIQNLRLQTEVLNQQLEIIHQIKKSKSNSDESNSKSI